jgi:hypothetical protein
MLDLERQIHDYVQHLDEITPRTSLGMVIERAPAQPRVRPIVAFAGAAILVLVIIGIVVLASPFRSNDRPVIEPATTTLPATTATTAQPTTTQPPTTTAEAAAPLPVVTWTRVNTPGLVAPGREIPHALIVVDEDVVLVGGETDPGDSSSRTGGPIDAAVWRSEDGVGWQQVSTPDVFGGPGTQVVTDFAVHEDTIVAVGSDTEGPVSTEFVNSQNVPGATTAAVWVSEDVGLTWIRVTGNDDAFADRWMHAVIATPDGFLAVGTGIWTSPDGLDWSLVQDIPGQFGLLDVAAFEGGYVAIGYLDIWGSKDGTNWTPLEGTYESHFGYYQQVAVVPGGLLVVGANYHSYYHAGVLMSSNGTEWHEVMDYANGREVMTYGVAVDGDFLVAVGGQWNQDVIHGSGFVWESVDGGDTWVAIGNPDDVFGDYRRDASGLRLISPYHDGYIAIGYTGATDAFYLWNADIAVWIGKK